MQCQSRTRAGNRMHLCGVAEFFLNAGGGSRLNELSKARPGVGKSPRGKLDSKLVESFPNDLDVFVVHNKVSIPRSIEDVLSNYDGYHLPGQAHPRRSAPPSSPPLLLERRHLNGEISNRSAFDRTENNLQTRALAGDLIEQGVLTSPTHDEQTL